MRIFFTWLVAGFIGAASATLWLGVVSSGPIRPWNLLGSAVTFAVAIVAMSWFSRPSQLSSVAMGSGVGYALGWETVDNYFVDETMIVSTPLILLIAVGAAITIAYPVLRFRNSQLSELPDSE